MTREMPHPFNAHVQPPVWNWVAYRNEHLDEKLSADAVLGIQSAFTVDFLTQVLEAKLCYYGRKPKIVSGGFNQYRQELLNASSAYYQTFRKGQSPLATVILPDPRDMSGPAFLQELRQMLKTHSQELPETLILITNAFPTSTGSAAHTDTNSQITKLAGEFSQVRVLDLQKWVEHWGWQRVVDPKHEFLAGMLVAPEMTPSLAEEILAFVYERLGLRKKCLVLDLDDTLWGGIVGEEGLNGIQLDVQPPGNVYRAIQETALDLRKKGVLLAVASKNNPKDAMEVIDRHPMMVLRKNHFADIQIGWQPKDQMLRKIAENLNIGVDSLVFLDDSANERELVRAMLPDVTVLDPPKDPAWWPRYLQGLRCFEAATLTEEDKQRARMYEEEKKRQEMKTSAGTLDEYLKSLGTVLTIGRMKKERDENLPRVAQLSQRTNQFNLTTRRYTEAELTGIVKNGGDVYWMKVSDRLGDSGLVGVAVVVGSADQPQLDNFFMSCRVIGRGVERAFLQEILKTLKQGGSAKVGAEYIPSEKNMQTRDFYTSQAFTAKKSGEAGAQFELDLKNHKPEIVPHVKVEWST